MTAGLVAEATAALASPDANAGMSSATTTDVDTPQVDSGDSGAEVAEASTEGSSATEVNGDQSTGKNSADALDNEKSVTPASVRSALKQWRDAADPSTPEGKAIQAAVKT